MAVKIKLKRMGKIREPYFRIIVADARTKRDGRAIEEIGKYHPKADPSVIEVDSQRAQHWLSVGAQPTDPVRKLLEVTGDWQRFKGLPGAEGTLKTAAPRAGKEDAFTTALAETVKTLKESEPAAKGRPRSGAAKAGPAKSGEAKAGGAAKAEEAKSAEAKAEAEAKSEAKSEAPSGAAKSPRAKSADAKTDKPARARSARPAKAAEAVSEAEGEQPSAEPEANAEAEPVEQEQEQAAEAAVTADAAEPGGEG